MAGLCAFDDLSVIFDDLSVTCFLKLQETVPLTLTLGSYHLLSYRTYDDDNDEDDVVDDVYVDVDDGDGDDDDDDDDDGDGGDDGDDGIFSN